jgi:DNA-binding IclR family transcriptional regulator
MAMFRFDFTASSHDMLKRGIIAAQLPLTDSTFGHALIAADSAQEAEEIAFEMISLHLARWNADNMITELSPIL